MANQSPLKCRNVQDFFSDENEFPSLSEVSRKGNSRDLNTNISFTYSDKLKASHKKEKWPNISHGKSISLFIDQDVKKNAASCSSEIQSFQYEQKNFGIKSDRLISREGSVNKCTKVSCVSQINETTKSSRKSEVLQPQKPRNNLSNMNKTTDVHSKCNDFTTVKSNCKKTDTPNIPEIITPGDTEVKKKKRNRKSKVRRQAARQVGKVSLLTPEAHCKIISQSTTIIQNSSCVSTNINDCEEYPELGKVIIKKDRPPFVKRNIDWKKKLNGDASDQVKDLKVDNHVTNLKPCSDSEELEEDWRLKKLLKEKNTKSEIEAVSDKKHVVHPKDPITLSFFDILLSSKPKIKEKREKHEPSVTDVPRRTISKKAHSQPHNLLDSTCVVKRGKERENPKAKKKTHMKKIIILDRQKRKEHFQQLKCLKENVKEENTIYESDHPDSSSENQTNDLIATFDSNSVLLLKEDSLCPLSNSKEAEFSHERHSATSVDSKLITNILDCSLNQESAAENGTLPIEYEENLSNVTYCQADNREFLLKTSSDENESSSKGNYHSSVIENNEIETAVKITSSNNTESSKCEHLDILMSVLNSNICDKECSLEKSSCFSEEERLCATKILIHTRKFREYCFHLTSKEIDNAVTALLSDLARFQDRMHQKDPVKAHIKRRMVYGIKEVKKHLKLRKLKCVILATDIENIQTEGGLNDVLFDLKQSAADHHIPCIFALGKRKLGKLCHKPVAVSCIGIFNYEGSEANFKKLIELLDQSKEEYNKIVQIVMSNLSDDEIRKLIQTRSEAPEALWETRTEILRKIIIQKPDGNSDICQEILVPCYVENSC